LYFSSAVIHSPQLPHLHNPLKGKAFAYKRFVSEALMKDFENGRAPHGLTKLKAK